MKSINKIETYLSTLSKKNLGILKKYYKSKNIKNISNKILENAYITLINYQDVLFHEKWYNYINLPFTYSQDSWLRYAKGFDFIKTTSGYKLYVITMPKGFRIYHGSQALPLAHAEFPIKDPKCSNPIPTNIDKVWDMSSCTKISYYAFPPDILFYAAPFDKKKMSEETLSAYGKPIYGDTDQKGRYYDSSGRTLDDLVIESYQLKEDTPLMLLAMDTLTYPNATFGLDNCEVFLKNVDASEWQKKLISFAFGILPLIEQFKIFKKYMKNTDQQSNIKAWYKQEYEKLKNSGIRTSDKWHVLLTVASLFTIIDKYPNVFKEWNETGDEKVLYEIKGFRWSTFEIDRVVLNMLLHWISKEAPQIQGFISDSLQRPQGICGGKNINECIIGSGGFDNKDNNMTFLYHFHHELALWYSPNNIVRTPNNPFDNRYGWNTNDIIDEMRKFKTSNLAPSGFHQGHLAEHSIWVALYAQDWINKALFVDLKPFFYTIVLAALLHDIGKMGECVDQTTFKQFDTENIIVSKCINKHSHFEYSEIANHPLIGYEYLSNIRKMPLYSINLKYLKDMNWEEYLSTYVNDTEASLLRIAVAIHWDWGPLVINLEKNTVDTSVKNTDLIKKYISKFEMFYNNEFTFENKINQEYRLISLKICSLISLSDILGSEAYPYFYINKPSINVNICKCKNNVCNNCLEWKKNWVKNMPPNVFAGAKPIIKNVLNNLSYLNYIWDFPIQTSLDNNYNHYLKFMQKPLEPYLDNIVILFDLDGTLINNKGDGNDYYWINTVKPDHNTLNVIKELQKWRPRVKLAIVSRHYYPDKLKKWLIEYNYLKYFDQIIVQYTGIDIKNDGFVWQNTSLDNGIIWQNTSLDDGIIWQNTSLDNGKWLKINKKSKLLKERTKDFHLNIVKKLNEPKVKMQQKSSKLYLLIDDDQSIIKTLPNDVYAMSAIDNLNQNILSIDRITEALKISIWKKLYWA